MEYQKITTVAEGFASLGLELAAVPDFSKCPEKDRQPMMDHYLMIKMIEAINPPDFVADLSNFNQRKVYLWPDIVKDNTRPAGFRFSYCDCTNSYSVTFVGSRRAFADTARAEHFWKYFSHLFESYSIIIK